MRLSFMSLAVALTVVTNKSITVSLGERKSGSGLDFVLSSTKINLNSVTPTLFLILEM